MNTNEKNTAISWISDNEKKLSKWHEIIWNYAEPVWREYKSAQWYINILKEEGFDVEEGSGGMPTAFCATFGDGKPVLSTYAEYDAVPGNNQQAVPYKACREGLNKWAAGHTDPHSALGIGALGGILAVKAAMVKHNLKGTLKFFGEPAEKVCGSKPVHALNGYYDDIDAAISFHPAYMLPLFNTTRWDTHCGSYWGRIYTFECDDAETWGTGNDNEPIPAAHYTARAPGAIDALCMMYTSAKMAREAMLAHSGSWSINEAILVGGQATADNLAPHISQIQYSWRAPTLEMQQRIYEVLENTAKKVADMTHCKFTGSWVTKTRPGLPNHVMADLTYRNLEQYGAPQFDEKANDFAREIQKNLGFEPMDQPFASEVTDLISPQDAEAVLRKSLPEWQKNYTSDDYVEYTWHTPTARVYIGRPMLKSPVNGKQYPAWAMNALGGYPASIDPMIFSASRCIAGTLIDLLTIPEVLEKAQAEFVERTGGGIGGEKWLPPLLPKDFKAPIHYRWPEYVSTPRGEEWWIPTEPTG